MADYRPLYLPPVYQDAADAGRVILRDGSTAAVRRAVADDRAEVEALLAGLSEASRRSRFLGGKVPAGAAEEMCTGEPADRLTLLVLRLIDGLPRVIAAGSYFRVGARTAEVAFTVADEFHGKGLATLLLERLAVIAVRNGFERFRAVSSAENRAMSDVFRDSGFTETEVREGGYIETDLMLRPTRAGVARLELRDRLATAASLRPLLAPRSIAVVGASRDPASIGGRPAAAIRAAGFTGAVYLVNPRAAEIGGLKCFPSVRAIPEPPDAAVIAVPRDAVAAAVDDCAARGVRGLIVITAGFAEADAEGRERQRRLVEQVRGLGMRMVGPNCMGLINADPAVRLNASFSPVFPPPGRIAMSSQSGALGLAILALAAESGVGLSTFVSVGNKADVSGNDLIQYWEDDPNTDVILLYLESFGNPRRFARLARRVGRTKPIVAVKSGRSRAGGRAAGSHTAALAASDTVVEALFRQTGVVRADTLDEMFDLAVLLSNQPLPRGRRVGVLTNAGGPAILCTDACEAAGLTVPEFSPALAAPLRGLLSPAAAVGNPVDMIASAGPEQYRRCIETLMACGEIDSLAVLFIPVDPRGAGAVVAAIAAGIAAGRRSEQGANKAVLASILTPEQKGRVLSAGGEKVPVYVFPENLGRALGKAAAYAEWRAAPPGLVPELPDVDAAAARAICRRTAEGGAEWLSAADTLSVLRSAGLPAVGRFAAGAEEAAAAAAEIGFPVAIKLASQTVVHKTEAGGVRLNLPDQGAVRAAFDQMSRRVRAEHGADAVQGVLVQPMIAGGVELLVGVAQDPVFGPLVAFGLGGVFVEILGDVCFGLTPLTDRDADRMLDSIRGRRLLEGYRGKPAADREALRDLLLRVSRLAEEVPEIEELDLNPVFALPPGQGCRIADARIRVKRQAAGGSANSAARSSG
jgi:acyl-CoA synthetase (NDP forming)/GNAT superfamily N-acetyltransferase